MHISGQDGAAALWRRNREILFQLLDDELLAVDAESGYCYSLNESAGRVWKIMEQPMRLAAICAQLRREYRIDEATCLAEVSALLEGLRQAGLVAQG
jgi:PqqD family protein of HPr-rel-A system